MDLSYCAGTHRAAWIKPRGGNFSSGDFSFRLEFEMFRYSDQVVANQVVAKTSLFNRPSSQKAAHGRLLFALWAVCLAAFLGGCVTINAPSHSSKDDKESRDIRDKKDATCAKAADSTQERRVAAGANSAPSAPSCAADEAPTSPAARMKAPAIASALPGAREHRALWVDWKDLEGSRQEIRERLLDYARARFNTLCIVTQKRGYVLYPGGSSLPMYPELKGKEDLLEWVVAEAHRLGFKVEAWPEYGFMAYWTPKAAQGESRGAWLDRSPALVSLDAKGEAIVHRSFGDFFWLDSANPEAGNLVIEMWVEMIRKYPFDGINLDRVRFASAEHGFGAYSRRKFQEDTGLDPATISQGNDAWKRWRTWRKDQLTLFAEKASRRLRQERPGLRITMAGVPPDMIDDVAQNWPEWLKRGYVDGVYPMLYETKDTRQLDAVRALTGGDKRIYAGLSIEAGLAPFKRSVEQWRAWGGQGIACWYSTPARPLARELAAEVFTAPAASPLYAEK